VTTVENLVMQPITLCNLACTYCYLPLKEKRHVMQVHVAEAVAKWIDQSDTQIKVTWHCGEPLATPISHFEDLLLPFREMVLSGKVVHIIQTNATLLNRKWCELLKREKFVVAVSIDGPRHQNTARINRAGQESHDAICRGISSLAGAGIDFSALSVVNPSANFDTKDFYYFFKDLGCKGLGINFEETIGVFKSKEAREHDVIKFWSELYDLWSSDRSFRIREFDYALAWISSLSSESRSEMSKRPLDLIPTISYDGDVVVLSPEFLQVKSSEWDSFSVGNLNSEPLADILEKASRTDYVASYGVGRDNCLATCEYFEACGGGSAASKFFENRSLESTTTTYCRNGQQLLLDVVLGKL
jgi:uncharacterized protein